MRVELHGVAVADRGVRDGVRVNAVSPGFITTNIFTRHLGLPAARLLLRDHRLLLFFEDRDVHVGLEAEEQREGDD